MNLTSDKLIQLEKQRGIGCYIHIPFCDHICYYCDFSKVFIKNQPVDDYLRALIREWELLEIKELRTLYIGGGTPTAISAEQLDYLLSNLQKNLDLSKLEEFTIEANPGDLTIDKIEVLKKSAVNQVLLDQTYLTQIQHCYLFLLEHHFQLRLDFLKS